MTWTGTASLNNRDTGYDIIQNINAYNAAKIFVNDKDYTNIATLLANPLKSLIKTHTTYSTVIFRGEIRDMLINTEEVTYNAHDKARKLLSQRAEYNAILETGYLRQISLNGTTVTLRDDQKSFGVASEYVNHLMHFVKQSKNSMQLALNDETSTVYEYDPLEDGQNQRTTSETVPSAITENGAIEECYHSVPSADIEDENLYINYRVYTDFLNADNIFVKCPVYFSLRTGVSVSEIEIDVELATRPLVKFGALNSSDDPAVGILDRTATPDHYDVAYLRNADVSTRFLGNGGTFDDNISGLSSYPPITKNVNADDEGGALSDLRDDPDKYIEQVEVNGDSILYKITLGIFGGVDILNRKLIKIRNANVNLTLDQDQYPELGSEVIASHTNTTIVFGSKGSGFRNPLKDCMSRADSYIITDTLDDQINTLASQWGITINDDITNASALALTSDYTDKSRFDVLQAICQLSNSVWWYDPAADAYYIVSADKLDGSDPTYQSGITITRNDVVNWHEPGAWSYKVNADNIRDTLVVQGDEQIGSITKTLNPEFSHALGSEEVTVVDTSAHSVHQLNRIADNVAPLHENAHRTAKFTIDLDNPLQSYANLKIGNTIAVQWPTSSDTSICNHTTGGLGELLVTDLQWVKKPGNNNRRLVTVTAKRRYS